MTYGELKALSYRLYGTEHPNEVTLKSSASDAERLVHALLWDYMRNLAPLTPDVPSDLRQLLTK